MILPPYARDIRRRREQGIIPDSVEVFYTWEWHYPTKKNNFNIIMLRPEYYEPGKYDFQVLAGVRTTVITENADEPEFMSLLTEIGRYGAPVFIQNEKRQPIGDGELSCFLFVNRRPGPNGYEWPDGWSDELDEDYSYRCKTIDNYMLKRLAIND